MSDVIGTHGWWRAPGARRTVIAAPPPGPVLAGAVLGLCALGESVVRSAATGVGVQRALVLGLVALATTLPATLAAELPAAIAVVGASAVSLTLFHTLTAAAVVAQPVAMYRAGRSAKPATPSAAVSICLPFAFLVLALARPVSAGSEPGVLTLLLVAAAPAAALAGLARQARTEVLRIDAARQAAAGDLLEHAARGERARIARELHDVVAHHISMIAVQAETARLATPGMPAAGAQRLNAIGDMARSGLTEMRRLLGVLREDADVDAPDLRPQPGLKQLNELLDQTRDASGCTARLILCGSPVPLDPGVELAAYRIVQEALTNARRHAPGAAVDVELRYSDRLLSLRIRDNGPGSPGAAASAGLGLTGMRERATAAGGRLHTAANPGGGFVVEATLPADAAVRT